MKKESVKIKRLCSLSILLLDVIFFNDIKDIKKREEDDKFIEKQWKAMSHGQPITETDEQILAKLLSQDMSRKLFINLFSKIEINLSSLSPEQYSKARDTILQTLQRFLIEVFE